MFDMGMGEITIVIVVRSDVAFALFPGSPTLGHKHVYILCECSRSSAEKPGNEE